MKTSKFTMLLGALAVGTVLNLTQSCTDEDEKEEQKQEQENSIPEDPSKGDQTAKDTLVIVQGSSSIFKYKLLSDKEASITGVNTAIDSKDMVSVSIPDGVIIDGVTYEISDIDVDVFDSNFNNIQSVKVGNANKLFKSIDGVLYKKDTLIYYPKKKKVEVFEIPEGTVSVKDEIYYDYDYSVEDEYHIKTIKIPASLTSFYDNETAWQCSLSCDFFVDPSNKVYKSVDGYLLKGNVLVACPKSKIGTITLPSEVTVIGQGAFLCHYGAKVLTVPSTVTIEEGAFGNTNFDQLELAEGIKVIGDIFGFNTNIDKLIVPESVVTIDFSTFEWMQGTVYLPKKWESEVGTSFGPEYSPVWYPSVVYY